jgi:Na+-driven multidrug efflux pump
LTTLDIATPAIAVAAASIVNIIGDLALSPRYGIQGAAIATALATVTSCCILLRKVRKTTNLWKTKQYELEKATSTTEEGTTTAATAAEITITAAVTSSSQNEGIETETKNDIPFWSIPDKASLIDLFKLAGPIFFAMMVKVACYNVMTIRATNFGIVPLASHNIMMRIFFFFACFGDSLSQAAQSFYPQVDKKVRGKLIKRLFWIASFVGLSNNLCSRQILSRFGRFLTKDSRIIELMATHASWVGFAVLLHPFIMLLEGTVLAKRDLVFMIGSYTITSLLHFGFVFSPVASTFAGLWRALFGFQLIRLVQFAIRVWQQSRATRENGSSVGSNEQDGLPVPPL